MISLNLLPPAIQQAQTVSKRLRRGLNAVTIIVVIVLIGSVGIAGLWVMMNRHANTVATELQKLQQQQATSNGKTITDTTSQLNSTIKSLAAALGSPRLWSNDAATILTGLPTAMTVSSLSVQANGQFHLVGLADSRQSFVQLEDALKANTKLSNIATTSTASKRVAVPFDYSGQLVAKP